MEIQVMHDNFFNNGFHLINDPEVFVYLDDIDGWEWANWKGQGLQLIKRNNQIEKAILDTQILLAEKYVKNLDPNYSLGKECEIVNGMDDATLSWHNDNIEGYNLCILLYFDTMDTEIGGKIRFRSIDSKEVTGEFFPKKYDVAFLNHCSRFEHVVTPMFMPLDRRVASFNFNIDKALVG